MKKHFVTGIAILLPVALTVAVIIFILNFLTDPFVDGVKSVLNYFNLFQRGFWILTPDEIQLAVSKFLVLTCLFISTVLLGILARWVFIRSLIRMWDYILHRIPLVRSIYKISQDVSRTLFSNDGKSFKQTVLVPYPNQDSYCIGFITRDSFPPLQDSLDPLIAVFVPTTPNPTSGFLLLYKEKDVIYLDMKVDDAFKGIISCGMILPPLQKLLKTEI